MKKIVLLISVIALTSCTNQNPTPIQTKTNNNPEAVIRHMDIVEFGYNNHDYIMFTYFGCPETGGVIHNPDCHCLNKE